MSPQHGSIDAIPERVLADLLESRRRCHVLDQLAAAGGEAIVDDLAAAVRAAERGCAPGEVGEAEREELHAELFERHLPKFTAIAVLEYDSMLGTVSLAAPEVASKARRELDAPASERGVSKER
jgi:hypothetical protein